MSDEKLLWDVRLFIYKILTDTEQPPTAADIAARFGITSEDAQRLLRGLHDRHAIFLDPDSGAVRMANPYSAVPTPYRVLANGHSYWANCAWDAFGIAAMLGADAEIEARTANDDAPLRLTIRDGQFEGDAAIVHFLQPFAHWYDNLIFT